MFHTKQLMIKSAKLFCLSAALLFCSCTEHFIADRQYRDNVHTSFESRSVLTDAAGVSLGGLCAYEREALEYLYAGMSLGDMLNFPQDYYLDWVRVIHRSVCEMPWGSSVPESELLEFVVSPRVGEGNLCWTPDDFYYELAPLLKNRSMHDAALEVAEWSLSKNAGPERLCAALRSMAIPARLVSSQDACVQAWADGKWYIIDISAEGRAIKSTTAFNWSFENKIDPKRGAKVILRSCENYSEIMSFLKDAASGGRWEDALRIMELASDKDLRETPASVFQDHLDYIQSDAVDEVISPRVDNEPLFAWRGYLKKYLTPELKDIIFFEPDKFVTWCSENLALYSGINSTFTPVCPQRVWETRICDEMSRGIFFVACCRAMGVPAWKDAETGMLHYKMIGEIFDVAF